jgi:lipase
MGPLFTSIFGLKSPVVAQVPQGILAIHGVYAHGTRYVRLAELLPEVTVVAPDLRGHGRSPKHGPYTIDQHVRDLGPLLRRMGPRTVVLGHSYGGLLAWELARANHDQLAGLVLVDPAIAMDKDEARREQVAAKRPQRWPDASAAFDELMAGRPPEAQWSVALDVAVGLTRDDTGWLRPVGAPEAVHAAWDQVAQRLQQSPWRGPTLLVEAGQENGRYVSPWLIKNMRQQLGDRLEHVVIDAAHTITADAPAELAGHVTAFLDNLKR